MSGQNVYTSEISYSAFVFWLLLKDFFDNDSTVFQYLHWRKKDEIYISTMDLSRRRFSSIVFKTTDVVVTGRLGCCCYRVEVLKNNTLFYFEINKQLK